MNFEINKFIIYKQKQERLTENILLSYIIIIEITRVQKVHKMQSQLSHTFYIYMYTIKTMLKISSNHLFVKHEIQHAI